MKIVHLSHTDAGAGAGRAAYRIHTTLRDLGVQSDMLVAQKRTSDASVHCVTDSGLGPIRRRIGEYAEARTGRALARDSSVFFSPAVFSSFSPGSSALVQEADLVAAYWINGGFITPEALGKIDKPVVWRLSDVWPFTGGCHYPGNCSRFEAQCGSCPQLSGTDDDDHSHRLWKRKRASWQKLALTVVAPSHWMASLARRSSLFAGRRIEVIPTGVDLTVYSPGDRAAARARLGLPQDRQLILFGAMSPDDDRRKGYHELRHALEIVARSPLSSQVIAVVFGGAAVPDLPVPALSLGRLNSDADLCAAYNSADLVAVPSLEDNLPNVALEAIACGAPVAAFQVCGMPDIVVHGGNGMLADLHEPEGLGRILVDMLSDGARLEAMRYKARQIAVERFSLLKQAQSYLDLYEELVAR